MKPVQQLFALVLEEIPEFKKKLLKARKLRQDTDLILKTYDDATAERKITSMRNKEIESLLFNDYIQKVKNMAIARKNGSKLTEFFKK